MALENRIPALPLSADKELGGEIITIGADAHAPEKIGYDFDRAAQVLKECGFEYYTVFKERKPEFIRL